MNANELRIDNFVLLDNFNTIVSVTALDIYHIDEGFNDAWQIPLTEEWLLKLGLFKITKKEDLWSNDKIGVYGFKDEIRCSDFFITSNDLKDFTLYVATIDDGMESAEFLNNIKYVHQLQNLYFALTGEELTIIK